MDDHIVRPGKREEMVRGRLLFAPPANEPHADTHVGLGFAVRGLVRPGFVVADDLLTRFSAGSNFATDISVRKAGVDPSTGARYLEELSFEVVSTQSLRDITERTEDVSARGVRRFFAIFVKKKAVCEWSPSAGEWLPLLPDGRIEDECLVEPLPVRALLEAAEADDTVARALLAKGNPTLEQARQDAFRSGVTEGHREGRREAVELLCQALDIELTGERRKALDLMDAAALKDLLERLARLRSWPS